MGYTDWTFCWLSSSLELLSRTKVGLREGSCFDCPGTLADQFLLSIDAVLGFLQDTPLSTGSNLLNSFVIALVVGTLSLVPDLGYLSKASASGLVVLGFTFATIAVYAKPSNVHGPHLNLWPHDGMTGASNWFGCVVFGFGVAPLTYNYYESMAQPQYLTNATAVALLGVALCYMLIGCSLLSLYFPVQGDILQQLPIDELVPLLVRLAMIVVVVLTSPLIVLPCGLILEKKLMSNPTKQMKRAKCMYL